MTWANMNEDNFVVRKMPSYREPGAWYWEVVDRRNGMSTMRRFPTESAAQAQADRCNGRLT